MYKHNRIGPWPMIELQKSSPTASAVPVPNYHNSFRRNVYIPTDSAGGVEDPVSSVIVNPAPAFSLASNSCIAFGVILPSWVPTNPEGKPFILDFSYAVTAHAFLEITPFVGVTQAVVPDTYNTICDQFMACGIGATTDGISGVGHVYCRGANGAPLNIVANEVIVCGLLFSNIQETEVAVSSMRVRQSWRYAYQPIESIDKSM